MSQDIIKRMDALIAEIEGHRRRYYFEDNPIISDAEYDLLEKQLLELEAAHPDLVRPHSTSFRVGGGVADDHPSIPHRHPMLSLENAYTPEDLKRYFQRTLEAATSDLEYAVELKIDGLSLSVVYEKGFMTRAITRGDGRVGEDVSLNAKTIVDLPLHIPAWSEYEEIEVRGEVYIDRKNFEKLNEQRLADEKTLFANPRNAAAGSLRMMDSSQVAKRGLRIFTYQVLGPWADAIQSHMAGLSGLKELGFPTNPLSRTVRNLDQLLEVIEDWSQSRHDLNYETDGVVIKVDDRTLYDDIGYTAKFPKWAAAYKFAAEQATTQITGIEIQVGRTGVLTPVANFDAVQLAGTTVTRATLHNFDELTKKDIRINDTVFVEKGGDIIPKVVSVILEKRPQDSQAYPLPEHCPSCGSKVVRPEGEVAIRCVNLACPAQLERRITHFASRGAMDIQGLGKERVQQLVGAGLLKDLTDIYKLTTHNLLKQERMGGKSVKNLLKEIQNSKERPFANLLFAVGIPMIGQKVAEELVGEFPSYDQLKTAQESQVAEIHGLGEKVAQSLKKHLDMPEYAQTFETFRELGLQLSAPQSHGDEEAGEKPLEGKTMVITGSFTSGSRTDLTNLLKSLGAKVTGSVTKNTDILVAGEKAGSKLAKAESLNVEVVDEEWLKQWQNP